ncbi:MAG: hypothetical protein AAF654_05200 [Myxococcota bacterium]
MKRLTPETEGKLRELRALESWGRLDERRRLLAEIASSNEVLAVTHLAPLLLDSRLASAAAAAIHQLMYPASQRELQMLHESRGYAHAHGSWPNLKPSELDRFDYDGEESVSLLGLASFHMSGFVREQAVKKLAGRQEDRVPVFLSLRVNDWVPQVRARAVTALLAPIDDAGLKRVALALPTIERLRLARRVDHRTTIDAIHRSLRSQSDLAALRRATESADRWVRRSAYRLLWSLDDERAADFASSALNDRDLVVRTEAARRVLAERPNATTLRELSRSRVAAIRRLVLRHLIAHSDGAEPLVPFLDDESPGIRSVARFYLRRRSFVEFAPHYRARLKRTTARELATAIRGLSETGEENDLEALESFLASPTTKVRCAAVVAFDRLSGRDTREPFVTMLADGRASVSNAARSALSRRSHMLSGDWFAPFLREGSAAHVTQNVILLIGARSKWGALQGLLQALRSEIAVARVNKAIECWISAAGRSFVTPSVTESAAIREELAQPSPHLGVSVSTLRLALKGWID